MLTLLFENKVSCLLLLFCVVLSFCAVTKNRAKISMFSLYGCHKGRQSQGVTLFFCSVVVVIVDSLSSVLLLNLWWPQKAMPLKTILKYYSNNGNGVLSILATVALCIFKTILRVDLDLFSFEVWVFQFLFNNELGANASSSA